MQNVNLKMLKIYAIESMKACLWTSKFGTGKNLGYSNDTAMHIQA